MLPTHALVGLAIALPVAIALPESANVVLFAGLLGGIVPDLDLYLGHRKTLHYPVYYTVLAAAVVTVALFVRMSLPIAVAVMLIAAAVHSIADVFGGGLELRPWEATSDRAVYDHHRDRWIAPRRWIRYDGAPEDLLLTVAVAGPLLVTLDGAFRWVVVAALTVATAYTVVRRALPAVAESLLEDVLLQRLPDRVVANLPTRYVSDQ
ncbi:hypothetical protein SAMN05216285_3990 [Natrinema salifodinae]|uniref:LexA-binding, inner membrane-associated hydrolase n=2 Tax=Natrinema salifodinae TaxID=1202768 RepID=A0A1I0QVA8_9EURY|nr:hypothetical protein SAMN05216285_3990 [Natrinema salifodinae]